MRTLPIKGIAVHGNFFAFCKLNQVLAAFKTAFLAARGRNLIVKQFFFYTNIPDVTMILIVIISGNQALVNDTNVKNIRG